MVLGFGAAVLFGWLGVNELRRRSDAHAMQAAEILGLTLTERLRAVSTDQRSLVLERAARRAGVELLLADPSGNVVVDATLRTPSRSTILDLLCTASGTTHTQLGRVRYSVHPVQSGREPTSLIVFKPAQDPPPAMGPLLTSLAVLVTLLVGVAALVASALARDVNADVDFVRRRIRAMAKQESEPAGKPTHGDYKVRQTSLLYSGTKQIQFFEHSCEVKSYILLLVIPQDTFDKNKKTYNNIINSFFIEC